MKKVIAVSHQMKGGILDDDYTLYDNGEVLHEYDKHIYPGGANRTSTLKASELSQEVKNRLLSEVADENKELAKRLLDIKE